MNLITRVTIFVYALVMRGEHTGFPRYQKAQSAPRPELQQYNITSRAYLTRHVVTTEIHHGLTAQLIEPPRQEIDIFKMHTHIAVDAGLFAVTCPDLGHLLGRPYVGHSRPRTYPLGNVMFNTLDCLINPDSDQICFTIEIVPTDTFTNPACVCVYVCKLIQNADQPLNRLLF